MKRFDLCHDVRQALKRLPEPFANHYGVVPALPPIMASILPVAFRHAAAIDALARLETIATELADPWLVSRVLARREAVSSSAIEGTNSTLDELLVAEEGDDMALADSDQQALRQVRDYAVCLDRLIPVAREQRWAAFDDELMRDIHRAVMAGDQTYEDQPGDYRDRVVWIGFRTDIAYSTFNPPPPDDVPMCMVGLIDYLRDADIVGQSASLITRMALAHAHFEAIHPFRDGNGRVGRLLLPLMMAAEGRVPLYLSAYIEANRPAYSAALKAAQQQHEWHEMIGFVSDAIVGSVAEITVTRTALNALVQQWGDRRAWRKNSAALRSLALLKDYPIVTTRRLSENLKVTWPAAATAVEQLCACGILTERTGYRRNKLYAATEVLAIVNRPFGAEPNPI